MRNLGGAIGLAVIHTTLISNTKIFSQYLGANITTTNPNVIAQMQHLSSMFDGRVASPDLAALFTINHLLQRDAFIIAMNDIFVTITLIFIISLIILPFASETKATSDGGH
jgi:DHA2 family multidrug resistance protein